MRRARTLWDDALLTRVRDSLARLVSPHAGQNDFIIELDASNYLG